MPKILEEMYEAKIYNHIRLQHLKKGTVILVITHYMQWEWFAASPPKYCVFAATLGMNVHR